MTNAYNSRHRAFSDYEPFANNPCLQQSGVTGPIWFLNPTSTLFDFESLCASSRSQTRHDAVVNSPSSSTSLWREDTQKSSPSPGSRDYDTSFLWRSRDNRKGRHALLIRLKRKSPNICACGIERTNSFRATMRGLRRMFTYFPYWDISWLSSVIFTTAAAVWVANGCITVLLGETNDHLKHASAWTAFAGAFTTLLGSTLLVLEALNANQSGCLGWIVDLNVELGDPSSRTRPGDCHHHHTQGGGDIPLGAEAELSDEVAIESDEKETRGTLHATYAQPDQPWRWLPTWASFRHHYLYELGFLASMIQWICVAIFWLCKFLLIPEVSRRLSPTAMYSAYWTPEILACLGFVATSCLTMVETQHRWYIPAISVLGWHIGLWKLIGSIGFLISTSLGPASLEDSRQVTYNSNLASFWGSWAFLVGSLLQWFESLDKNPVIYEGTHFYSEWSESWNKPVVELHV